MSDNLSQPDEPKSSVPTFGPEIDLFTKHIDAIGDGLVGMVMAVQGITKQSQDKLRSFEAANCEVTESGGGRVVRVPNHYRREWKRLAKILEHFLVSRVLLPRSLLVSIISQYDAYLGRILRTIFIRRPEILNASEKKISFDMLSQFTSIDAAREYVLEKEVEAILRASHADQFKWMESVFGIPLTKDLARWPDFIELTERRNLFVHTDGVVSSQYMAVCRAHKCRTGAEIKEGVRLDVSRDYFVAAHQCIYEIGAKLGHVLWRKLFPEERAEADNHFTRMTYDLIDNGKFSLAIRLLDFACGDFKKFSSEGAQLTMTVNRAQAHKWNGDEEGCKRIMKSVDWSAKADEFRLADAVLAEDWGRSTKVMRRIGRDGSVNQVAYRDWPLFRYFRRQSAFLETYSEVFGESFERNSEVKKVEPPSAVANISDVAPSPESEAPSAPDVTPPPTSEAPSVPDVTPPPTSEAPSAPEVAPPPESEAPSVPEVAASK